MRVGDGEARPWVAGRVTILDDSFEHEIFNEATEETRVLLLIDVWHPQLTLAERDAIRRHFGDEPRWEEPRPTNKTEPRQADMDRLGHTTERTVVEPHAPPRKAK
jgi:hypothetical protein